MAAGTIHTFTIAADSRLLRYDRFAFMVINMEGSAEGGERPPVNI